MHEHGGEMMHKEKARLIDWKHRQWVVRAIFGVLLSPFQSLSRTLDRSYKELN
jgi:hypothetical protein